LGQLVVVSNRVAVPEKIAKVHPGGLEVAIRAALKDKTGIWFGWSGKIAVQARIATRKIAHDKITYITLDLSKEDHHEYYNGFTNRVLWPILHYRVDLASSRAGI
jgi:trehalose 6-phosphate synthase